MSSLSFVLRLKFFWTLKYFQYCLKSIGKPEVWSGFKTQKSTWWSILALKVRIFPINIAFFPMVLLTRLDKKSLFLVSPNKLVSLIYKWEEKSKKRKKEQFLNTSAEPKQSRSFKFLWKILENFAYWREFILGNLKEKLEKPTWPTIISRMLNT